MTPAEFEAILKKHRIKYVEFAEYLGITPMGLYKMRKRDVISQAVQDALRVYIGRMK